MTHMTRLLVDLHSDAMDMHTQLTVLLPDEPAPEKGFPVLYLLHGKGGDHTDWSRLGTLELDVRERFPLCVVMPSCQHSFYRDMAYGLPYYQYLAKELPEKLAGMLPISGRREDTFVCGRSMGGYGAMLLALNRPERFACAASVSGALDVYQMIKTHEWPEWEWIFGGDERYLGSDGDLVHMLEQVKGPKPRLFACCGLEDGLMSQNTVFVERAKELGYDMTFVTGHGGHDWHYGNEMMRRILDWLPLEHSEAKA